MCEIFEYVCIKEISDACVKYHQQFSEQIDKSSVATGLCRICSMRALQSLYQHPGILVAIPNSNGGIHLFR